MSKVDYRKIPSGERRKMVHELAQMLLAIENEKDMAQVLYRLLTPSEQVMLGRRKQVAEMLVDGATYASIQKKLHIAAPTIRNIEKWLEDTVRDFDRIRAERRRNQPAEKSYEQSHQRHEPALAGSFTAARRRSGRFFFLNLLLDGPTYLKS